jgi:hypothetical protein
MRMMGVPFTYDRRLLVMMWAGTGTDEGKKERPSYRRRFSPAKHLVNGRSVCI